MDNSKCMIQVAIEPKFGMLIGISLKNYAGVLATGILTNKKERSIDEIKEISEYADKFFNNTLESLPHIRKLSEEQAKSIQKLTFDYLLADLAYETVMMQICDR